EPSQGGGGVMRIGSLFAGTGGLDMAVESVFPGALTAWFCEWDEAPSRILAHHLPDVPNLRDVTAVDWSQVEPVDIITGGFPCQDVSHAGRRQGLIRDGEGRTDRKSTRLNSSHVSISYAVFCLKKKKKYTNSVSLH